MQVDSIGSSHNGLGHLDSEKEPDRAAATADGTTIIEHTFDGTSNCDWSDLLRQIAAITGGGGGRITLTVTIESNEAHRPPQPVRIVTDPAAPALQPPDVDRLYPWRQKDLVGELNRSLGRRMLNSYDIQAVRRHHQLDARPDFVFHLPGAGRRYSPAVADWIMGEYTRNAEFFREARAADQEVLKLRRQKPR
jgi:hypothetical protein